MIILDDGMAKSLRALLCIRLQTTVKTKVLIQISCSYVIDLSLTPTY